jgi:hypothetical protein
LHTNICKNCAEKKYEGEGDEPYGGCCQHHFEEMMIANTYNQLELLIQVVEALQYNEAKIPHELLEKMFRITHLTGVRCRYDSCDYDRKKND